MSHNRKNIVQLGERVKVRLLNGRNLVNIISETTFANLREAIRRGFYAWEPFILVEDPTGWSVEVCNEDRGTYGRYNIDGRKLK